MSGGHFGPGVIGEEAFAKEQAVIDRFENIFGPGVLDPAPDPTASAPASSEGINADVATGEQQPGTPSSEPPPASTLSIAELKAELAANPDAFDKLMQAEYARPEGPRKGALRELLANEEAHATPRPEVIAAIKHALGVTA